MVSALRPGRLFIVILLCLTGYAPSVFAVNFLANWNYRSNGGEDIPTRSELQQRYSLLFGPSLEYQPSHAITANGNVAYSRTEQDLGRGAGRQTVEAISPGASLTLTNDIFRASLSGLINENRPSAGSDFTNRSWDATLGSAWVQPLWPSVQFNYSERDDYTHEEDTPGAFHDKDQTAGISVTWDLILADLYYDYSRSRREDVLADVQNDSENHFVRLETDGSALQKRFNYKFAQQFVYSVNDLTQVLEAETSSALTDPDALPNPLDFENLALAPNPQLSDENRQVAALVAPDPENLGERRVHLGVSLSLRDEIEVLHVYIDTGRSLPGDQAAALQWDLYTRDLPGIPWEPQAVDIPATFEAGDSRLVLAVGVQAREFMVVATVPVGQQLTITELEAIRPPNAGNRRTTTSHLTNLSLRMQITPTLSANSGLSLERTDSEAGNNETQLTRRTLNGTVTWNPSPFVVPSASFSESKDTQTGAPELLSRSYGFTVMTYPLPTLNVTLGATRSDRYEDEVKRATNTGYSLSSSARIYPDLNASLILNLNESENFADDGGSTTSESFFARLNMNARLRPAVTADLTGNYRTISSLGEETSSTDTTLSLRYRPSDLLSVRWTGTRTWTGPETPDVWSLITDLGLVRTRNTRLVFQHRHRQAEETSDRFGLNGSWDINRNLFFQTRMDYTVAERNTWRVDADLSLRL